MKISRRQLFASVAIALICISGASSAQTGFPTKPLTIVLPVPPGGTVDFLARQIQPKLSERLGQQVIIDSRPGASGRIASQAVARANPDGYTLLLTYDPLVTNAIAINQTHESLTKELTPVILIARLPYVITVSPGVKAKNLKDFLSEAKTSGKRYNYATNGVGTGAHLSSEDLKRRTGLQAEHIPYKGGAQAIQALMTDEVQFGFNSYPFLKPFFQDGKVNIIAVGGAKRIPDVPDVATVAEQGYPGFDSFTWQAVLAPAGTPAAVVKRLNQELDAILKEPQMLDKLKSAGFEVVGGDPTELGNFMQSEHARLSKFVKETGIKLE